MYKSSKPAIVLDLNNTLISTVAIKTESTSFSIKVGRRRIWVQTRPGLSEFLKELSDYFEIYFFTASSEVYASQIIDRMRPSTPKENRFYKHHCKFMYGYLVKDLSLIERKLDKILLVDDTHGSAILQPNNLIRITSWYGDLDDCALMEQLLPALTKIAREQNLPDALQKSIERQKYSDLSPFIF